MTNLIRSHLAGSYGGLWSVKGGSSKGAIKELQRLGGAH